MVNPDGVVNGNYRCSLAGVDLNRVSLLEILQNASCEKKYRMQVPKNIFYRMQVAKKSDGKIRVKRCIRRYSTSSSWWGSLLGRGTF